MNRFCLFCVSLFALSCFYAKAEVEFSVKIDTVPACDSLLDPGNDPVKQAVSNNPDVLRLVSKDSTPDFKFREKKILAAVLSFPIPFGLLGLHRIFLGTKPYIPFVYMGTVGGCFLVLPIIDFIAILSANEDAFKRYENNPKVFMWSH